jgi:hypothetical protein
LAWEPELVPAETLRECHACLLALFFVAIGDPVQHSVRVTDLALVLTERGNLAVDGIRDIHPGVGLVAPRIDLTDDVGLETFFLR